MDYKYCKIYVAKFEGKESLIKQLSKEFSCKKDRNVLVGDNFQIYVDNNDDFNVLKQSQFPDGFLYFPYCLEIDFEDDIEKEYTILFINRLLNWLWQNDHPAIAVCDYESELSNNGGYKSDNIPWLYDI